jgi:hypothetical protein
MLTMFVTANGKTYKVNLNGYDRLTPKSARSAIHIAFGGLPSGNQVTDENHQYGYRVYPKSTRKIFIY